jgi:hypothetical protein
MIISKKMLSEVLNIEVTNFNNGLDGSLLPFQVADKEGWQTINIYELAFKCKEFALDKGYEIESSPNGWIRTSKNGYIIPNNNLTDFLGLSEYEAIFKAFNYILKEIDNGY